MPVKRKSHIEPEELDRLEAVVDDIMSDMIEKATYYEFAMPNVHDLGLICESIRSAMFRTLGRKHALQDLADNIIQVE